MLLSLERAGSSTSDFVKDFLNKRSDKLVDTETNRPLSQALPVHFLRKPSDIHVKLTDFGQSTPVFVSHNSWGLHRMQVIGRTLTSTHIRLARSP